MAEQFQFECLRCGHLWNPRKRGDTRLPKRCGNQDCKSKNWATGKPGKCPDCNETNIPTGASCCAACRRLRNLAKRAADAVPDDPKKIAKPDPVNPPVRELTIEVDPWEM